MAAFKEIIRRMNKNQRIVIGLAISLGIFVLAYAIADEIDQPYDFKDTWFVWLPALAVFGWLWYEFLDEKG